MPCTQLQSFTSRLKNQLNQEIQYLNKNDVNTKTKTRLKSTNTNTNTNTTVHGQHDTKHDRVRVVFVFVSCSCHERRPLLQGYQLLKIFKFLF